MRSEFPVLREVEFQDVVRQVIEAKRYEQERIGWQAVPHDVTVLVFVLGTTLFDLRTGIVAAIATLVLLESLFQFYFNRDLYRPLSTLVWLTYPAYLALAYALYRRGYGVVEVIATVVLAWAGPFLVSPLARLPARMMLEGRAKGAVDAARLKEERSKKDTG